MNSNMNRHVANALFYKVFKIETRTKNPCVGGSIPPLDTIRSSLLKNFHQIRIIVLRDLDNNHPILNEIPLCVLFWWAVF